MPKIGRNSMCPCGSGLKYKHCCLSKDEESALEQQETAASKAENVIGGSQTIFRHAIDRANRTIRQNRKGPRY